MTGAIGVREERGGRGEGRDRLIMDPGARVVRLNRTRTSPAATTVLESVKIGTPAVGMIENGTEAVETAATVATADVATLMTDLPDVTCSTIDLHAVAARNATTAATEENGNGAPHPRVARSPLLI